MTMTVRTHPSHTTINAHTLLSTQLGRSLRSPSLTLRVGRDDVPAFGSRLDVPARARTGANGLLNWNYGREPFTMSVTQPEPGSSLSRTIHPTWKRGLHAT